MVVRRPDGLGTAQLTSEKLPGAGVGSDVSPDSSLVTVRPHSTVQRAHSTVIPRGSKAKVIQILKPFPIHSFWHLRRLS